MLRSFFDRPHPWIMQGLGGMLAVLIMIPISIYVWINVINNATPDQSVQPLTPPASQAGTGGNKGGGGNGGGRAAQPVGGTSGQSGKGATVPGAIAHPAWADVSKIFVANCSGCHVGVASYQAGLNLSTYQGAMAGGDGGGVGAPKIVIKPHDATGSYLWQVVAWRQDLYKVGQNMPLGAQKPIAIKDQQTIFNWIQDGAKA